MTEEQAQEMVQLPRDVVLDALPMLFWVSQAMRWDDHTHQEALRALYREAAAVFGITAYEVDAEEPVASQQIGGDSDA